MANRRHKIFVSLIYFLALKYVISTIIQLQIAPIHHHKETMMMIIVIIETNARLRNRSVWRYGRVKGFVDRHFVGNKSTSYSPKMIKERIRLNKQTYLYLCNILRPMLEPKGTQMEVEVNVETHVAVTLSRLSTGNTLRICGNTYGLAESTTSKIVRNCCRAVEVLLNL